MSDITVSFGYPQLREDAMISTEKLSAIIGAIYDCAVAPDRWETTLQTIRTELCFATAVLAVNPLPAGDPTIFATSGIAPEWLGRIWGYSEQTLELTLANRACGCGRPRSWLVVEGWYRRRRSCAIYGDAAGPGNIRWGAGSPQ